MARTLSISADANGLNSTITKSLQSGNINFLLGSGASLPAISVAGNVEKELNAFLEKSDEKGFRERKLGFLQEIQKAANNLIDHSVSKEERQTLSNYKTFLEVLSRILDERKTSLLPKQVTLFTTNYDLFIERASEELLGVRLNDGFYRNPSVASGYPFQPEHFFDVTYKTGNLYRYRFPIPVVNLIKLHGSLSWFEEDEKLIHRVAKLDIPVSGTSKEEDIDSFLSQFSLILPTKEKFDQTLMLRVYYDLLRIFANTLEVENTILMTFGFSFDDEHVLDITTRALKNPTLLLIIFAYEESAIEAYRKKFKKYNNVLIVHPEGKEIIDFECFNKLLADVIPKSSHAVS